MLGEGAHFFRAEVTDETQVKASIDETVARFGRLDSLDALFNNAGARTEGDAETISQAGFEHAMILVDIRSTWPSHAERLRKEGLA
jgi:NAD(P)-dependent dehydrogenase (short-subunit alcohol dehydrogenase family)